jgi:hypothetical protein
VLRSIQDVMLAVASLRDVEQDLLDHVRYPTLLGNQATTVPLCIFT